MENLDFCVKEVIRIIHRKNAIDWHVENMSYDTEYVMVIVLDGETEYIINNKRYLVKENDLLIFSPKLLRSGKTNPHHPWSFVSIIFRMEVNEEAHEFFNKPILIWENVNETFHKYFLEASKAWTGKNSLFQVNCNMLITKILYRIILSTMPYQKVPHIKKLEKARTMIQENFTKDISVEELANSIDMSVSYFRRLFHEAYGYSPMEYIINLRIENASDLLLSGEVNVTEAARLSGYDDIYYFSTLFKKKTGNTPSQLIKNG